MAVTLDTYTFFASGAGTVTTVAQWEIAARQWLRDGVIVGELNELSVYADATGMQVKVRTGYGSVRGHIGGITSEKTLGITTAHASLTRIDRVVLRLDDTNSRLEVDVVAGTAGAGVPPTLVQTSTVWEVALARVTVPPADVSIDAGQVTDERTFARPHGVDIGDGKVIFGATAPDSAWLLCQGQAVSRVTYADLFAKLGTAYGAGDGSTTFQLPNMAGRVPVGRNSADSDFASLGQTGGEKKHTLAVSEMPSHAHQTATGGDFPLHKHPVSFDIGTYAEYSGLGTAPAGYFNGNATTTVGFGGLFGTTENPDTGHQHPIASDGGGGAHNILQPYIVLNYAVRAR